MPRLGMGMPIVSDVSSAPVVAIDDFVFLNDISGELTPNSTAVRKNLLLQSQTFKTTWTTNNAAIPNDLYTAPDSTLTAQAITANSAGASDVFINQVVATTAGETYTYSAHVKVGANGFVIVQFSDGSTGRQAWFNADTGSVGSANNLISTHFQKLDNGWRRVSITFQADSTTSSSFVRIFTAAASGSTATGAAFDAGTDLLYIWGAQLEEDSRPSNYMVTTNTAVTVAASFGDVSEVWDFDGTDVMLEASFSKDEGAFDRATANLVLNGDYEDLSAELITNADFANGTTDWTVSNGTISIDNDRLKIDGNNGATAEQTVTAVIGKTYKVTYTFTLGTATSGALIITGGNYPTLNAPQGTNTFYTTATQTNLRVRPRIGSDGTMFVDNVSVKQVDPNNRWIVPVGWSIESGKAVSSSGNASLTQDVSATAGVSFEVNVNITDYTSGTLYVDIGGSPAQTATSAGNKTFHFTTSSTGLLRFYGGAFIGSIDNVTVKEYAITPKSV